MITIDLQDDEIVEEKKSTSLDRDESRRGRDRDYRTSTSAQKDQLRSTAKRGLIARFIRVIFKEV